MKNRIKIFLAMVFILSAFSLEAEKVKHIHAKEFRELIFDYKHKTEWENKTKENIMIDFYALWCGPCRRVSPVLEKLQKEFAGRLTIYKVNVDKQKELAQAFGVKSLPTFLFIPKEGQPVRALGALKRETFLEIFRDIYKLETEKK